MADRELKLEELMLVNGGSNAAAAYINELALAHKLRAEDGTINLAELGKIMQDDEWTKLDQISRGMPAVSGWNPSGGGSGTAKPK